MGIEVAAAAIILGTAGQAYEARKQARDQEKIQGQQAAVDKAQLIQQRRADFRRRRIAAARIRQAGENTGTGGSSTEAGAISSIATGAAATRSALRTSESASVAIRESQNKIFNSQVRSTIFQGVKDLGSVGSSLEDTSFDLIK